MSSSDFKKHISDIIKALHKRKVQYLTVGGTAIAFHDYIRPTTNREGISTDKDDFDFWYLPTHNNYWKLVGTLEDLGFDMYREKEDSFPKPKQSFFRFTFPNFTLDFIPTTADGLKFLDCYGRRKISIVDDIQVSVLSLDDLLVTKRFAGRKKDLADIKMLEQIQQSQKNASNQ